MTTEATVSRTPTMGTVMAEQLRVVGLAVRWEATIVAVILGLATLVTAGLVRFPSIGIVVDSQHIPWILTPDQAMRIWAMLAGLLFPFVVWKGERFFGESELWRLPVGRRRHALTKVLAGWMWLMTFFVLALAWMLLLTVVIGGSVGAETTRWVVNGPGLPATAVLWSTQWWEWLMPSAGATAAYLFVSALLLGMRHPIWSAAGVWAAFLGGMLVVERTDMPRLTAVAQRLFWCVGLLVPRGAATATIPGVGDVLVWSWLPSLGLWLGTAAIWLALSGAAVTAAAARHRDP